MAKEPIGGTLAIEVELRKEKASALRRVAGKLESLLDDLREVEGALPRASSRERPRIVEKHKALRAEAEKYRWYLIVQREALGLFRHDDVMQLYPIPPAVH
jgi:hypothetical protein